MKCESYSLKDKRTLQKKKGMDGEKQRQADTNVETHRRYTDRERAEGTPAPSHRIYKKKLWATRPPELI